MPRRGIETDTNSAASWTRTASAGAGRQWFPAGPRPFPTPGLVRQVCGGGRTLRDIERAVCQLLRSTPRWRPVTQAPAPGWSVMPS